MKAYQDKETEYLVLDDISRGVRLLSEQQYQEIILEIGNLHRLVTTLQSELDRKTAQISAEQSKMDSIAQLCDKTILQMDTIRSAYYWKGYCNGAWYRTPSEAQAYYDKLWEAVKDFPAVMQDVLCKIKQFQSKENSNTEKF